MADRFGYTHEVTFKKMFALGTTLSGLTFTDSCKFVSYKDAMDYVAFLRRHETVKVKAVAGSDYFVHPDIHVREL